MYLKSIFCSFLFFDFQSNNAKQNWSSPQPQHPYKFIEWETKTNMILKIGLIISKYIKMLPHWMHDQSEIDTNGHVELIEV